MEESGALSTPLRALPAPVRQTGRCLVLSHCVNMLGSKAWEFAIPLLLIRLSGGRLVAPAILGIVTTAAEFLCGPTVGRWVDGTPSRMSTVAKGAFAQAAATLGVVLLAVSGVRPMWFTGDRPLLGGLLFAGICCCGVVEVLGRMASSVSIERDWVPTAFEPHGEAALARVNARMANVDLLGELAGPLLAGALMVTSDFTAVAALNIVSFVPQLWLLAAAQRRCEELRELKATSEAAETQEESAWRTFVSQPSGVPLLAAAYALLFFTVLSSHDVVLMAFLSREGLSAPALAVFRAVGAAAGVLGASTFEVAAERWAAGRVAGAFLSLQAVAVAVAAVLFHGGNLVPFLGAIVVSRVGLYGFDVGFSTLSQSLVDERQRGAVGAITEGLCALAQLLMYAVASVAGSYFAGLVLASASSVVSAAGVFGTWRVLYHEHEHYHNLEGHEQGHGHGHEHEGHSHSHSHGAETLHSHKHTAQQLRTLLEADASHAGLCKHRHVHYHPPQLLKWR